MHIRKIAVAGAAAVACTGAWSDDINVTNIDLSLGTAPFVATHVGAGAFTDTFSFVNGPSFAMTAGASLVTIAVAPGLKDINFTAADLNGNPFTLSSPGVFEFASVSVSNLSAPFKITVSGTVSGVGPNDGASYSGTLSVTPVPEPGTYAMMIAGIAAIGFLAARRQRNG